MPGPGPVDRRRALEVVQAAVAVGNLHDQRRAGRAAPAHAGENATSSDSIFCRPPRP